MHHVLTVDPLSRPRQDPIVRTMLPVVLPAAVPGRVQEGTHMHADITNYERE